jgi:stage II sporulation protein AA (anti-sigma F factor antagonist)
VLHQSSLSRSRDDAEFYAQLERPLRVEMAQVRDSAWVQLQGELEFATAADAEAAVVAAAALMQRVTIDLRGVEFIDFSGVALLLRADRRAQLQGSTMRILASPGPVTRLLGRCGLDRALTVVQDPEPDA